MSLNKIWWHYCKTGVCTSKVPQNLWGCIFCGNRTDHGQRIWLWLWLWLNSSARIVLLRHLSCSSSNAGVSAQERAFFIAQLVKGIAVNIFCKDSKFSRLQRRVNHKTNKWLAYKYIIFLLSLSSHKVRNLCS